MVGSGADPAHIAHDEPGMPRSAPDFREARTDSDMSSSALDIYCAHFGLKERPFSLMPDPDFLFWSEAHRRAYTMLEYGILTRAPITLITGEIGAGKTTLLHQLLRSLDDDLRVGLISNAQGDRGELLHWVLRSLGLTAPPGAGYVELFDRFQATLIEEYAAGRRVVLVFDEAQNLSLASLEELRMFTNINAGKDDLVQLILVGQPELRQIVRQPRLVQFAQRVAASFHLAAMDAPTVRDYIHHRLKVAGAQAELFSPEAMRLVHEATRGVPRLVNQLCDLALVYAFSGNRQFVTGATVQQILDDGVFFAASLESAGAEAAGPGDAGRGDASRGDASRGETGPEAETPARSPPRPAFAAERPQTAPPSPPAATPLRLEVPPASPGPGPASDVAPASRPDSGAVSGSGAGGWVRPQIVGGNSS